MRYGCLQFLIVIMIPREFRREIIESLGRILFFCHCQNKNENGQKKKKKKKHGQKNHLKRKPSKTFFGLSVWARKKEHWVIGIWRREDWDQKSTTDRNENGNSFPKQECKCWITNIGVQNNYTVSDRITWNNASQVHTIHEASSPFYTTTGPALEFYSR